VYISQLGVYQSARCVFIDGNYVTLFSEDTADNLPVADSSGLTAGTPSSPHLSANSTSSSSSQANAVNGNSSNPFKKSNTSTPSATPTPVFGKCVQETTTPKEDNSKDVFSMSPLSRMGELNYFTFRGGNFVHCLVRR